MKRLALDSSLRPISIALSLESPAVCLELADDLSGAENLVSVIKEMFDEAGVSFDSLDEIIVASGPGPFIGLRVGLAAAVGISIAAGIPLKSVPSFVALASFVSSAKGGDLILVHQPARKGWTAFQTFNASLAALTPLHCLPDEDFAAWKSAQKNLCVAPIKPPEPLSQRLLALSDLAQVGVQPIYPPTPEAA